METQHQHLESLYPQNARFEDIEKILSFVTKGDSCQMIAMPGVGRGNILKFLAYNRSIRIAHLGDKQTQYHFVYINFDEIKHRPVIDSLKFIFLELVSSLHERNMNDAFDITNKLFNDSLITRDELVLFQGLKESLDFLAAEKQLHIIFLFERFETYLPMLTPNFFTNLRSLRNKAKYKFSVVFSVTRPLEETVEPTILADFFEFFAGHELYLDLTDIQGIQFRITYLEQLTGHALGSICIKKLLSLTAGHGKLTRTAVELILGKPLKDLAEYVEPQFLLSQKTIQAALLEIWNFLSPSEQSIMLATSHQNTITKDNNFLEKIHLLDKGTITISLFAFFLQREHKHLLPNSGLLKYDEATNTIMKGVQTISEILTSSEFRLLRLLLQNEKRVLEREEIITGVWKDTTSTMGVTDQALDQLIFRLRKKIEDNPNIPHYIQTVKGRGIMFTNKGKN